MACCIHDAIYSTRLALFVHGITSANAISTENTSRSQYKASIHEESSVKLRKSTSILHISENSGSSVTENYMGYMYVAHSILYSFAYLVVTAASLTDICRYDQHDL